MRTDRTDVHEGGEGDDPEVCGIDYIATIELEESWDQTPGRVDAALNKGHAKRPSANQPLERNKKPVARLGAPESMEVWYPSGPGGAMPSTPENLRLSMKETDRVLRLDAVNVVTTENMRVV